MSCKQSIVSLLDELLRLFEHGDTHKTVYRLLICIRHKIRNTYSDEIVYSACKDFYEANASRLADNDVTAFNETPYATLIDVVWNELGPANRELVWKWGVNITSHL